MKKVCMFLFIGVFLGLMTALPCVADEGETSKVKFSINVGGMMSSISQGYDFLFDDFEGGDGEWTEAVANIGMKFGFDIGASIFPISQLEIYASYSTYGGTALGDYGLSTPAMWEWPASAHTLTEVESDFKATALNIGVAFHPEVSGKIKPYFGAGLSSVTVKMDLLNKVSVDEYYEYIYYETWSDWWWEYDYNFEITGVGFTEESETVWGFHAKAGVNFEVAKNISIFIEGRYLSATAKFERPDVDWEIDWTDHEAYYWDGVLWWEDTWEGEYELELEIDDDLEIKVGGIQGIVGIKLSF